MEKELTLKSMVTNWKIQTESCIKTGLWNLFHQKKFAKIENYEQRNILTENQKSKRNIEKTSLFVTRWLR